MNQAQFCPSVVLFDSESWNPPGIDIEDIAESERNPLISPMYNVVLIDDDNHTYEYVIEMLMKIVGLDQEKAFEMTLTVDYTGRVVVFTGTKKIAEMKRDEILSYGPDWRLVRSKESMSALVEPVE